MEAMQNTDRELWRERDGDYYADSIHVTKGGGIGINCGGTVYVKPIREWHKLAGGKIDLKHPHGEFLLPAAYPDALDESDKQFYSSSGDARLAMIWEKLKGVESQGK